MSRAPRLSCSLVPGLLLLTACPPPAGVRAPAGSPAPPAGSPAPSPSSDPVDPAAPAEPPAPPAAPDPASSPVPAPSEAAPPPSAPPRPAPTASLSPAEELAGAPASREQVAFVRLASLTIGGDFDGHGAEEICVTAARGGERLTLLEGEELELPAEELERFELPDSPWVELPDGPVGPLDLGVRELDVTDSEQVCGTARPVSLGADAFGDEAAPGRLELDLGTIRGVASGFLRETSEFVIPDARAELLLVLAPRRTGPDAAARQVLREVLGPLLEPLASGAEARGERLEGLARDARGAAGRSTHTWLRARLAEQAERLDRAARIAGLLGQEPPYAAVQAGQVALRTAPLKLPFQKRVGDGLRSALAAVEQVAWAESPEPGQPGRADALAERLAAAEQALAACPADPDLQPLREALTELALALQALRQPEAVEARLATELEQARAALRQLLGE